MLLQEGLASPEKPHQRDVKEDPLPVQHCEKLKSSYKRLQSHTLDVR